MEYLHIGLLYAFHIDAPFSLLYHNLIQTGQSVYWGRKHTHIA